jgi:NAD+ synthase (glutamine-hydrolysing)
LVQRYVALGEGVLGRALDWAGDDLALQNIQARVRAPSAWLIANVNGALLLSTSNRSEAAVGYATMDGDTAGSISPIAGIDKAFLRRWLVWLEHEGLTGLSPVAALAAVNEQSPTAELRPQGSHQTDEDDLMPYDVLDAIERSAIRDKRSPTEILESLRLDFPSYGDALLVAWITRFFRLFCRNQWKRERYAPSFHLDDESLDPKTWYRFPILSGGFERELAALHASLDATSSE